MDLTIVLSTLVPVISMNNDGKNQSDFSVGLKHRAISSQGKGKTFSWVGAVSAIDIDEEQFGRNPSLQSNCSWEDKLAQLFPMGYCDYWKKMRKYSGKWGDHVTLQAAIDWRDAVMARDVMQLLEMTLLQVNGHINDEHDPRDLSALLAHGTFAEPNATHTMLAYASSPPSWDRSANSRRLGFWKRFSQSCDANSIQTSLGDTNTTWTKCIACHSSLEAS
ncbi:uncharacterized protein HKW66_Vig0147950 [Vigna angularis]|uniref:Uncharacterized protein n=1 Tax=Phaseolus angularis TaxID=3914 RepID=A0A8T0JXT4_PHAAN|nr:uncharacterized protein HKW66_Vig0147950 [Vigna angularis]